MLGEERREYILNIINKAGSVNAKEVAQFLGVSEATIRRDLGKLAKKNLIKKTYGGALKSYPVGQEMKFNIQKELYAQEKRKIALAAAKMIEDKDVIIIESGTTGYQIALNVSKKQELTVFTNSCEIAATLLTHHPDFCIILSGGILDNETRSLIGPIADNTFFNINVDKAFIGITGIDIRKGITAVNPIEANTKKNIIASAKKVIALADHSKLGHISVNFVSNISAIDMLITDSQADKRFLDLLEKSGISVIQE